MVKPYLIVTGDFVKTGGMDRANYALADYLARQGGEVHLVAYQVAQELKNYPNLFFHPVPKMAGSYFLSEPLLDYAGRLWARIVSKKRGRIIVNGGNCLWGDANWVHYVHAAFDTGSPRLTRHFYQKKERRTLKIARLVFSNSECTKNDLVERLGVSPERIQRLYYGIDPKMFYPASSEERTRLRGRLGWERERLVALFLGSPDDRRKGFDILLGVWKRLCQDPEWDVDLVAIGSVRDPKRWQHSRVRFLGFRSDVPDLLRAADCLVAPSRYEAYGLGVHEALCSGLPAFVSEKAGVAERYPQELRHLLLPNPGDCEDIARRLRDWRSRLGEYRSSVQSLSETLRRHTWDDMVRQMLEKIEEST